MRDLFDTALLFRQTLVDVADWLLSEPLDGIYDNLPYWATGVLPDATKAFLQTLDGLSVSAIIIGAGLTAVLGYKLISFIIDILP